MTYIYVAGSLRHTPKEWWKIYEKIGNLCKELGFSVHVPHTDTVKDVGTTVNSIHDPNLDMKVRADVYKRNYKAISEAKLIIAEVTNPSTGTGVEIGFALKLNKPIICLAQRNVDLTSMVLGPAHIGSIDMIRYKDEEDALQQLKVLLETKFKNLVKF